MKYLALFLGSLALAGNAFSQVTVYAYDDIYSAGNTYYATNVPGNGSVPVDISIPAGTVSITFSATGDITLNSNGGKNNADGVVYTGSYSGSTIGSGAGYSNNQPTDGLSGIEEPGGGGLVGVFENASTYSTANTAPASLDYYSGGNISTAASSYSPLVNQVFLIGDGLTGEETGASTGSGTTQTFYVPTGATDLFLGISDSNGFSSGSPGAYNDNSGSFSVTYDISSGTPSAPDQASTLCLLALSGASLLLLAPRRTCKRA